MIENKAKNPNSKHYELWNDFEAIDVIKNILSKDEYIGFLKGNILKYRLRAGKKNIENDNIIKDINKSIDYERELNEIIGHWVLLFKVYTGSEPLQIYPDVVAGL